MGLLGWPRQPASAREAAFFGRHQRMKAFHFILVFGLAGLFLPGCSTAPRRPPPASAAVGPTNKAPAPPLPFVSGNPDAFAHFAAGESYLYNQDAAGTLRQWEAAALADPSNERLVIEVAESLLKRKESDRALALLSKSASRTNASAQVIAWQARLQLQANHLSQALATSKRAIRRQPDLLDGYGCQLEVLMQQKDWAEAVKTLNRAARQVRAEPGLLLAVADFYTIYLKNQPKDDATAASAVALLDRIARLKFTYPPHWQRLAEDYARLNQEKKAAAIYNRLLADTDQMPSDTPELSLLRDSLREKLASLYVQSEDRTNASQQLKALIHDNPTRYPRAWFVLGELAYEGNNLGEAAEDFEKALQYDPDIEQAYYDLTLVQLDLHRSAEAFDTLEQARNRFAKTFACEYYSGVVYSHVTNYDEAIRHFKEAEVIGLATDPARLDQRFYFQFGAACERGHAYKQAEEYLQKCVTLAPDFAEGLNYLGYMLADRGEQLPRARTLIEKALSLEPRNGAYLDSLGWVLFKLNLPHQALPQMLKALQYTSPPDATVLDHLGEVYLALHQIDKAVAAWKKSLSIEASDDVKHKLERHSGGSL
jgi:tetratricopeptide (TPR) repeat protein